MTLALCANQFGGPWANRRRILEVLERGNFDVIVSTTRDGAICSTTYLTDEEVKPFCIERRKLHYFDDINPPLPGLTFGDVGLRSTEPPGRFYLG